MSQRSAVSSQRSAVSGRGPTTAVDGERLTRARTLTRTRTRPPPPALGAWLRLAVLSEWREHRAIDPAGTKPTSHLNAGQIDVNHHRRRQNQILSNVTNVQRVGQWSAVSSQWPAVSG